MSLPLKIENVLSILQLKDEKVWTRIEFESIVVLVRIKKLENSTKTMSILHNTCLKEHSVVEFELSFPAHYAWSPEFWSANALASTLGLFTKDRRVYWFSSDSFLFTVWVVRFIIFFVASLWHMSWSFGMDSAWNVWFNLNNLFHDNVS